MPHKSFAVRRQDFPIGSRWHLIGVVDENNDLKELQNPSNQCLVIDLAEIERMNSCGVRDWVNWIRSLEALGTRIALIRCSPTVIAQINMVANFCSEAYVYSFYAPYFDPETEEERNILFYTKDFLDQDEIVAPTIVDERTGRELEFDDYEESYFAFIHAMKGKTLDPCIQKLLETPSEDVSLQDHTLSEIQTPAMDTPPETHVEFSDASLDSDPIPQERRKRPIVFLIFGFVLGIIAVLLLLLI